METTLEPAFPHYGDLKLFPKIDIPTIDIDDIGSQPLHYDCC